MAKIFDVSAYPTVSPAGSDLLIGTDVNDSNKTVTFKVSDIVGGGGVAQDLTSVLIVGNSAANDITLTGSGILTAVDVFPTVISAGAQGSHGSAGQVLTSTGVGIAWDVVAGGAQTWDDVVGLGNTVSNQNIALQDGGFQITQPGLAAANFSGDSLTNLNWSGPVNIGSANNVNVGDYNLVNSTNLKIAQTTAIEIDDGTTTPPATPVYSTGSVGQMIVSTNTGVKWSSGPTNTPHTLQQVLTQGNTATDVGVSFVGTSTSTFGNDVTFNFGGFVNITGNADTGVPTTKGILKISGGALDIEGDYSELRLKGIAGTSGQVLLSQGTTATPIWSDAQIAPTLQNVLDNSAGTAATGTNAIAAVTGNAASGLSPTEGIIQAQNGAFNLWGDYSELQLKGSAGAAGEVIISQGDGATPVWGVNGGGGGSGTLTGIGSTNSNYVNTSIDNTTPASPVITSSLVSNNLVTGGPASGVDDMPSVVGTGYNNSGVFDTVAILPSTGTGLKVQIDVDGNGAVDEIVAVANPGIGYQIGDTFTITSGNNDAIGAVTVIISGTYYGQTGGFTVPPGNDWDLSFTGTGVVGTTTTVQNGGGYPNNLTSTNTPTTVNPSGGSGATYDISTDNTGNIATIAINSVGSGYSVGDVLSIITGVPPTTPRTLRITSVNASTITLKNSDAVRQSTLNIDQGSGVTLNLGNNNNDLTISSNASGGTVTSVGVTSTNSTIAISGSPITSSGDIDIDLPTQTLVVAGTYANSNVTVDAYGIITDIAAGTDSPYTLIANAAGGTLTTSNPQGGAGYTASGTVGTLVVTGGGNNDLTVSYTNTGGAIDLNSITVVAAGTGYAVGDTFTVNGGSSLVTGTVATITPSEGDISLVNAAGVRDTIKLVEGANISITDSGTDSITIAATAAAGITSFGLATNPTSFTGTVDVTNNTITFVEKVNTIAGAPTEDKSYIALDLSDPTSLFNELTVGLSADTSALDTTTMLTHFLRADNTWGIPTLAGSSVDSLNSLTGALTLDGSGQSDIGVDGVATFSIIAGNPSPYLTMSNVGYPVTFSTTSSLNGEGCLITATNTGGVLSNLSIYASGKGYAVGEQIDIQEALGYPALAQRLAITVDSLTAATAIQSFTTPYTNPDLRTKVSQTGAPASDADPTLDIIFETPQKYDITQTTFTGSTGIDVTRVSDTEISFTNSSPGITLGTVAPINIDTNNIELTYNGVDNVVLSANNMINFVNGVNASAKGYVQNSDRVLLNDRVRYGLTVQLPGSFPPNTQYNNVVANTIPAQGTGLTISFLTDNNGNIVATNNSIEITNDGENYSVGDQIVIDASLLTPPGTFDPIIEISSISTDLTSYIEISQLADAVTSTSSWTLQGDSGTANITDNSIVSIVGGDGLDVTVVSGTIDTATITGSVFTLGDGVTTNGVQGFVPGPLIADFGTNKFLKVDGSWALPVNSLNTLTDDVLIIGSGDINVGVNGALTITAPVVQGSGYILNGIYETTGPGTGLTVQVTAVGASGEAQSVSIYAAGRGYTQNDTVTLIGQGSSGTAQTTVSTVTATNTIVVSGTVDDDTYDIKMTQSSSLVDTDPNLSFTRTNSNGAEILVDNIQILGDTGIKVLRDSNDAVTVSGMFDGTGDITVGENGVASVSFSAAGSGYVLNKIYSTTVSPLGGSGCTIKVTGINSGQVTSGIIHSAGKGYSALDVLTLTGLSSGNDSTFNVVTVSAENRIQISNTQDLEDGVTSLNTLTDNVLIESSGDITIGENGVATLTAVSVGGTGYVLNKVYSTTSSIGGAGCTIKVTGINGTIVTTAVVYSRGTGYAVGETLILTGLGSGNNASFDVSTLTNANSIQISNTQDLEDGVTSLNTLTDSVLIESSGDITIGVDGVKTTTFATGGTGYKIDKIYSTTVAPSGGSGCTIKVTGVNGTIVTSGVVSSAGQGYSNTDVLTLTGIGSSNNSTFNVTTLTDANSIQISNTQDLEDGVTSLNAQEGQLRIVGTGDIKVGQKGVIALGVISNPGTSGYVTDRIYRTSGGGGTGLSLVVTQSTAGVVDTLGIYSAGIDYTAGQTVTLVGLGSSGDCQVVIDTISQDADIQASSNITDLSQLTNSPGYTSISGGTQYKLPVFDSGGTSFIDSNFYDRNDLQVIGPSPVDNSNYQLQITGTGYIGLSSTATSNTVRIGSGYLSTENEGTAINSVYLGYSSGQAITDGYSNTFIGQGAGANITTGFESTYIGKDAGIGAQNTNSRRVVAIGALSAQNAYGDGDVFIGRDAGNSNTNVSSNPAVSQLMERVAIGMNAMSGLNAGNTTAQGNNRYSVAIGAFAGNMPGSTASGVSVGFRTHIGYKAGANETAVTNATDNSGQIAIGTFAMSNHTSYKRGAIAIGEKAYSDTINASPLIVSAWDVAIGAYSFGLNSNFYPEIQGEGNIAIGYLAGTSSTANLAIAGGTIAIGKKTQATNTDTIAIGTEAAAGGSNINNCIAIGKNAIASIQNSIALGEGAESVDEGLTIGSASKTMGAVVNAVSSVVTKSWPVTINGTVYNVLLNE